MAQRLDHWSSLWTMDEPKTRREEDESGGVGRLVAAGKGFFGTHPLATPGQVTIGRSSDTDFAIPLETISRRHAVVATTPLGATIQDLGSANGTFVNGERVAAKKAVAIRPSDVVRVGGVCIWIEAAPPAVPGMRTPVGGSPVVVQDPAMQGVHLLAERVARGTINVLLVGETGTGKEVLARTIHQSSPRSAAPFVALNCAAFSDTLLESELFGHEKGAFTGATEAKQGLLELANGGTVLLDEVGEMPAGTQAKVLRVLEERKILRIGATAWRTIDARFISATNRDLEAESRAGRFRKDLYFRLNGVTIELPPLRQRRADIEPLARQHVRTFAAQLGSAPPELSSEAVEALLAHGWPGNVRELKNVIERAVLLADDGPIRREHLQLGGLREAVETDRLPALPQGLRDEIQDVERERILSVLESCGGNQRRTAKVLGISRTTLLAKLDRYGVPRPRKGRGP